MQLQHYQQKGIAVLSAQPKPTLWQKTKSFFKKTFSHPLAKIVLALATVFATLMTSTVVYANELPAINIEVGSLMKAFAVIIAAIATIGMGVLTVALMAKAFKYIRSAF